MRVLIVLALLGSAIATARPHTPRQFSFHGALVADEDSSSPRLYVTSRITAAALDVVAVGQKARFHVGTVDRPGRVDRVRAVSGDHGAEAEVRMDFPNADHRLRAGMTGDGVILVDEVADF